MQSDGTPGESRANGGGDERPRWQKSVLGLLTLFTAIGSAFSGLNSFWLANIEAETKATKSRLEEQIALQKESREERGFSVNYFIKVYELTAEAANDPVRIGFVNQLISSTFRTEGQEGEFRQAYLQMLSSRVQALQATQPANEQIKALASAVQANAASTKKFVAEDSATAPAAAVAPLSASSYRYDVFVCEASRSAVGGTAEKLRSAIGDKAAARLRELPDSINASPGYRRSGYLIMIDSGNPDEDRRAAELAEIARSATGNTFQVRRTVRATPGYISLFLCPGSGY